MTPVHSRMTCEDIKKELKAFIGDLLPDNEYQAFIDHLDSCPDCTAHVRSLGSISNQVWELGDIEIPSDLDSTTLFKYKKAKEDNQLPRGAKPPKSNKLVIAIVIAAIGIGAFFGWKKFVTSKEPAQDAQTADEAVVVRSTITKKKAPADDTEAREIFNELQRMADSLAPISQSQSGKEDSEKVSKKEESAAEETEETQAVEPSAPMDYSFHWHLPYISEDNTKKIISTIKAMDILLDYEDPNFQIFKATGRQLILLSKGIQFSNNYQMFLPEFVRDGTARDTVFPASFYIERDNTFSTDVAHIPSNLKNDSLVSFERSISSAKDQTMDWHVLLISFEQSDLLRVLRSRGGNIKHASDAAVIFSIPGVGLKELVSEIQGMGGVFADFNMETDQIPTVSGDIDIMIYFSKQ